MSNSHKGSVFATLLRVLKHIESQHAGKKASQATQPLQVAFLSIEGFAGMLNPEERADLKKRADHVLEQAYSGSDDYITPFRASRFYKDAMHALESGLPKSYAIGNGAEQRVSA